MSIFQSADLTRADLEGSNLYKTNFSNAALESSNLSNANLTRSNLSNANLTRSNLSNANLFSADLQQAKLIGADLRGTNLTKANLNGADFRGAIFEESIPPIKSIPNNLAHQSVTKIDGTALHKGILESKIKILAVLAVATAIVAIFSLTLFSYHNPFSTATNIIPSNHTKSPTIIPNTPSSNFSGLSQVDSPSKAVQGIINTSSDHTKSPTIIHMVHIATKLMN